ncbi:MAG: hypothetical protein KU37_03265 [Sulfuricurvum sp. PC08-66]|nr:MAG: hypothetical protein KU37_03265 [Sulfuricurvum sp. PC08-66]
MRSPFAPIVKLKKESLEEAQRALAQIVQAITHLQNQITQTKHALRELSMPQVGVGLQFRELLLYRGQLQSMLKIQTQQLVAKEHEKNLAQQHLNSVMVEFEKFQYLQTSQEQAHLKALKKRDALHLDEVAIMGYNLQRES